MLSLSPIGARAGASTVLYVEMVIVLISFLSFSYSAQFQQTKCSSNDIYLSLRRTPPIRRILSQHKPSRDPHGARRRCARGSDGGGRPFYPRSDGGGLPPPSDPDGAVYSVYPLLIEIPLNTVTATVRNPCKSNTDTVRNGRLHSLSPSPSGSRAGASIMFARCSRRTGMAQPLS